LTVSQSRSGGKLKDVEEFIDDMDLEDMKKYTYDE
jgi:hypothetical protein